MSCSSHVVIDVRGVEPDEHPVGVLQREVAGGLPEARQDDVEVGVPAGVHLVVGVDRAMHPSAGERPDLEKTLFHLVGGARVIHVAQVEHQIERPGCGDLLGDLRRAIEARAPIARHRNLE
jgi:hypothetical protein